MGNIPDDIPKMSDGKRQRHSGKTRKNDKNKTIIVSQDIV